MPGPRATERSVRCSDRGGRSRHGDLHMLRRGLPAGAVVQPRVRGDARHSPLDTPVPLTTSLSQGPRRAVEVVLKKARCEALLEVRRSTAGGPPAIVCMTAFTRSPCTLRQQTAIFACGSQPLDAIGRTRRSRPRMDQTAADLREHSQDIGTAEAFGSRCEDFAHLARCRTVRACMP